MNFLNRLVHIIDSLNDWLGQMVAWLTLSCVLTCFCVVVLRYGFNMGFPWMQEVYVWQHALVFLLGAGYTFLNGGHVNVDIFYGRMSPRRKAWLDIIGTLVFLFPWLVTIAITSSSFILASWSVREASGVADGMPGLYLFKSVLWVFCFILFLQGLAFLARRILFLTGHDTAPHRASTTATDHL